ncbi:HypC/HybG/HupF family hydrogenase formation chaperone [Amphritea balenae]|uniref:HypC/HybG/HupF family hydrogenase formation chaperone n=1 Tax=Amphritea balenae TaxID=452629 RepID=A0A3P1SW21_9GAMM|nr:HypC/HybG/HupF family hydrogenase formation chaperone [Amphritea balenae]RRD01371.1 HypC/HybG/HupF family hydrogenase formation chaperone [Amphritea balenae]GGK57661.1 hydrogenase assembly protein HupF [Amphritea balenae]
MCLAIPVKVEQIIDTETAIADIGGVRKEINIALIADLNVGDYVILHVGYALNKIDPEEAERTLQLFAELGELEQIMEGHQQELS